MELKCLCGKPFYLSNAKFTDHGAVYKCECGLMAQWPENAMIEIRGEWRSSGIHGIDLPVRIVSSNHSPTFTKPATYIQHIIKEWRKGCSNSEPGKPDQCHECTVALIDSIDKYIGSTL